MSKIVNAEFVKDFFWRILFTLSKQGIVFYIFILTARTLSADLFGVYNYVLSAIFFLILLCDFGVSTATSKYVAEYHSLDQEKLKHVVFNALLMVLAFVGVIGLGLGLFGGWYFKEYFRYLIYFSPLIFLVPASSIYDGVYRGLKRFKEGAMITAGLGILFLFLAPFFIIRFGMVGSIFTQVSFYGLLFLLFAFSYKNFHIKFNSTIIKEIGKYSLIYGLAVISYQIFARIDVLFLGHYGFMGQIATYELLNKIFSILVIPFTLLGQVFAPRFTELFYGQKAYGQIYTSLKRYTAIFLGSGLAIGVFCFFTIPLIISFFFPAYINEYFWNVFVISLLIFTINITTATIDHGMIVATGHAKLMTWLYSGLAITNLVINVFAVKLFGYMGILYATLFCVMIMVVALRIMFFKEMKKMVIQTEAEDVSLELV